MNATRARLFLGKRSEIDCGHGSSAGFGREFTDAVSSSIELIKKNPLQDQRVFKDRRRAVVARFRFNLIYFVTEDEIVIVACLHGHRDPRRWMGRI